MCILYCCEGRKLDNSLGYYVTFVKERILYCIVLYHFRLYDFSQFRPCDVLQEVCLSSFHKLCIHFMHVNSHAIGQDLKETVLWGTVIWSEKGKQNVKEEG